MAKKPMLTTRPVCSGLCNVGQAQLDDSVFAVQTSLTFNTVSSPESYSTRI